MGVVLGNEALPLPVIGTGVGGARLEEGDSDSDI